MKYTSYIYKKLVGGSDCNIFWNKTTQSNFQYRRICQLHTNLKCLHEHSVVDASAKFEKAKHLALKWEITTEDLIHFAHLQSYPYINNMFQHWTAKHSYGLHRLINGNIWGRVTWSLHTRRVAYQVGSYPSFCSMKQLGVFLLPIGWDASSSLSYPQHKVCCPKCKLRTEFFRSDLWPKRFALGP